MGWEIIGDLVEVIVEASVTSKRPAIGIFIVLVIVAILGLVYYFYEK